MEKKKRSYIKEKYKFSKNKRLFFIFSLVILLFIYITVHYLIVIFIKNDTDDLLSKAEKVWFSTGEIVAKRGQILDRNMQKLAVSGNVYRIDLDLNTLREDDENKSHKMEIPQTEEEKAEGKEVEYDILTLEDIAKNIGDILDEKPKDIMKIFETKNSDGTAATSAILKRQVSKDQIDKIKELRKNYSIRSLVISDDTQRFYPQEEVASKVVGHLNKDGTGMTGIENYYNRYLQGIPGQVIKQVDGNGNSVQYESEIAYQPINGSDVVLTIDSKLEKKIQEIAEEGINKYSADEVNITVMNPKNGEIIGMATSGNYDLNDPWFDKSSEKLSSDKLNEFWKNQVIGDIFEVGSIIKPIVIAAALQYGVINENEIIVNCPGYHIVDGTRLECTDGHAHGEETAEEIIQNSCNVGAMVIAEKLGAESLYTFMSGLGLDKLTGVDLPGEQIGIMKDPGKTTAQDLATISYGHTNSETGLQYLKAFNAIVNGGNEITPHLLKEVISYQANGTSYVDKSKTPEVKTEKKIEKTIADSVKNMLKSVMTKGTGKDAQIEGYSIGGKTGTANMLAPEGGYLKGKYINSFVAAFPLEDPEYTILITVKNPKGNGKNYSSTNAVPIGKDVLQTIIDLYQIQPTE